MVKSSKEEEFIYKSNKRRRNGILTYTRKKILVRLKKLKKSQKRNCITNQECVSSVLHRERMKEKGPIDFLLFVCPIKSGLN